MRQRFWAREKGRVVMPGGLMAFCPVEVMSDGVFLNLSMTLMTRQPAGTIVGEFWFDTERDVQVTWYGDSAKSSGQAVFEAAS